MKLYLVRHTSAVDIAPSDAARALTPQGEAEARVVGKALAKLRVQPDHIFASPLLRAQQTAKFIAAELGATRGVETLADMENGSTTAMLLRSLPNEPAGVMILVGHMPSLSDHVATLAGLVSQADLGFGKGSVALVEMPKPKIGTGQLHWLKHLREM